MIGVLLFFMIISAEEPVYTLEPLIVTATRVPTKFSYLTRNVILIEAEEIRSLPVSSIGELLQYAIDLRSRGTTQQDPSIRGATFEQVLILIDGVKVNDPQTGHHNLDIPLVIEDVERLEILQGHGSSLYGPDAFGGVVNIITKPTSAKKARVLLGDYKTWAGFISYPYTYGSYIGCFSIERRKSDGWRSNTDFEVFTLTHQSSLNLTQGSFRLVLGYMDKDFGANEFYGTPDSREATETEFTSLKGETKHLESTIYYRKHYDRYVVDKTNPNTQVNLHTTYIYGGETLSRFSIGAIGNLLFGGEILEEVIRSNALGDWNNQRVSLFTEWLALLGKFIFNSGVRLDWESNYGFGWYPNIDIGYLLKPLKIRISIGKAFRTPSYTELFYFDPYNMGNPELKPEEAWSYELGMDWLGSSSFRSGITLFLRDGKNLIDWVKEKEDDSLWKAFRGNGRTIGVETSVKFSYVSIGYTLMSSELVPEVSISKYLLNHPIHQVNLFLSPPPLIGIRPSLQGYYKKKEGTDSYFLVDGKISRRFQGIEIFISGNNILSTNYEENPGVPMPNRWVKGGMEVTF